MPHWVPAALALAVVIIVALAVVWVLAELDVRQERDRADIAESRADDAERTAANRALRIRHYREQADQLRAELASRDYCGQVAAAALTADTCTDPLEALYALPAYDSEETS